MGWGRTWAPLGLCLVGLGPGVSRGRALGSFPVFKVISSAAATGHLRKEGGRWGAPWVGAGAPRLLLPGQHSFILL